MEKKHIHKIMEKDKECNCPLCNYDHDPQNVEIGKEITENIPLTPIKS